MRKKSPLAKSENVPVIKIKIQDSRETACNQRALIFIIIENQLSSLPRTYAAGFPINQIPRVSVVAAKLLIYLVKTKPRDHHQHSFPSADRIKERRRSCN